MQFEDLHNGFGVQRPEIYMVGHSGIRHDGSRIAVDKNRLDPIFAQRPEGLGTGVVKFTGLADNDGAGAYNQDAVKIFSFGHF